MSVLSVHASASHSFSKPSVPSITLLPNLGVQGDAHAGATVQHRSRLHIRPPPPNLRQVHLLHAEILAPVGGAGSRTLVLVLMVRSYRAIWGRILRLRVLICWR
ncbi:hypothetical protein BDBG_17578 [Blastomyces gilchristii SLH14081]|uniref:MOSC domain-containing protein n=1 Tax=Blastomyces gilchristii (strain SLH14081) TaxID=559298 RepID=A0A179UXD8_BLAGS|nr:uncharacterized protein BDBG_17578 [Blastomyces gilchristii SLH14081]OAT11767.1 hypothetical protein BDBG_17578 [Blastomyces gilchristii SLH14081]